MSADSPAFDGNIVDALNSLIESQEYSWSECQIFAAAIHELQAQQPRETPARLTDEQCNAIVERMEDFEWSGLTRGDIRDMDNAINEVRYGSPQTTAGGFTCENCHKPNPPSVGRPDECAFCQHIQSAKASD